MSGRGTKVTVGLEVDVTGTKDVDLLARSMDDAAKAAKDDLKVSAAVTGARDVATLVDTLDRVPDAPVAATVAATVTGDDKVDILAADIRGLPASTAATVAATVTGDDKVDILAADIHGLPPSTSTTVAATVTGKSDLDILAAEIDGLPPRTDVTVAVAAKSPAGQSLKDVGTDIDNVKTKSGDLAVSGSAFGSQFLGSYSEGAGLFGDLAEQLSNLKREADETGGLTGNGGLKGILSIAGGLGAGIIGGLLIDQVLGAFTKLEESQANVKAAVEATSQALIDNGGFWSQAAALANVAAIEGSDTFKLLIGQGESYSNVMAAMTSGAESVDRVNSIMAHHGESLGIMEEKNVRSLGNIATASKDATDQKYAYLKANNLLTDSQKTAEQSNRDAADGMDLVGDASRHAGDELTYAKGRVDTFNKTPVKDKKATVDVTDKATPKVDGVNKLPLKDKDSRLSATDAASPTLGLFNNKAIDDKDSRLSATDAASTTLGAFNRSPIADKLALIDANTTPAQNKIDGLDRQAIDIDVDLILRSDQIAARYGRGGVPQGDPEGRSLTSNATSARSRSAPRVLGTVRAAATVVAPVTVTVNGALDPAAVARQIERVMTRADRRTGPIRAGGRTP